MVVEVVARGEESKKKLADKGVTAGKITTGSVSRTSSGKRTRRSPEGEFIKSSEPVYVDGQDREVTRGTPGSTMKIKETVLMDNPNLLG